MKPESEAPPFAVGNIVKVVAPKHVVMPLMTVEAVAPDAVRCTWVDNGRKIKRWFYADMLVRE